MQHKTSSARRSSRRSVAAPDFVAVSRIPIVEVSPQLLDGTAPVKSTVDESFPVQATIFREGHDKFAARAVLVDGAGHTVDSVPMCDVSPGLFRFEGG